MKNIVNRIYLSGSMTGLTLKEQLQWRNKIANALEDIGITCYNPPAHFSDAYVDNDLTNASGYKSDREVMEYDLWQLRNSDLVVVNFDVGNTQSLGTMAEIAIAYDHRIPILGICKDTSKLHPWQRDMCARIFESDSMLLLYLCNHYLD